MKRPCRKRDRNALYCLMYGGSTKRASKMFLSNKQNRRMPARARKKAWKELKADFEQFCKLAMESGPAIEPKLKVVLL